MPVFDPLFLPLARYVTFGDLDALLTSHLISKATSLPMEAWPKRIVAMSSRLTTEANGVANSPMGLDRDGADYG